MLTNILGQALWFLSSWPPCCTRATGPTRVNRGSRSLSFKYTSQVALVAEAARVGAEEATAAGRLGGREGEGGLGGQPWKAAPMHQLPPRFTHVWCVAFLCGYTLVIVQVVLIVHLQYAIVTYMEVKVSSVMNTR